MSGICGLSDATAGLLSVCTLGGEALFRLVVVSDGSPAVLEVNTADLRFACFRLNSANQSGFLAGSSLLVDSDVAGWELEAALLLSSEDLRKEADWVFSPLWVGFRFPRAS